MDREQDSGCTDSALDQYPQRTIKPGAAQAAADGRCGLEPDMVGGAPELRDSERAVEPRDRERDRTGAAAATGAAAVTGAAKVKVDNCSNDHWRFAPRGRLERARHGRDAPTPKESMDSDQDIVWVTSLAHQHRVDSAHQCGTAHCCDFAGFASLVESYMAELGASLTRRLIVEAVAVPMLWGVQCDRCVGFGRFCSKWHSDCQHMTQQLP